MPEIIESITIERRKTEELRYNDDTGEIEVHVWTTTFENGKATGRTRHCEAIIKPGDDVSKRSAKVQTLARATWTPAMVKDWTAEFVNLMDAERKIRSDAIATAKQQMAELEATQDNMKRQQQRLAAAKNAQGEEGAQA